MVGVFGRFAVCGLHQLPTSSGDPSRGGRHYLVTTGLSVAGSRV